MRLAATLLLLACSSSCRLEIDTPEPLRTCEALTVAVCEDATQHADFDWIAAHVLKTNCTGSACHEKDGTDKKAAKQVFDGSALDAWKTLVVGPDATGSGSGGPDVQQVSDIEVGVPLVVPMHPEQSYLFFLMHGVDKAGFSPPVDDPPDTIGYMPKGSSEAVCCQKLDAVERWITAGAAKPTDTSGSGSAN